MDIDLRKTAADAAYIAVGAGVLGFQQAQVRRREAGERITTLARDTQQFVSDRACALRERVSGTTSGAGDSIRTLDPRHWVEPIVGDVRERVEPVIEQLKGLSTGLPQTSTVTDQLNKVPGHVNKVVEVGRTRVQSRRGHSTN
jgi:hypothetical protein